MVQYIAALLLFFIPPVSASSLVPTYRLDQSFEPDQTPCALYHMMVLTVGTTTRPIISCDRTQEELAATIAPTFGQVEFQTKQPVLWPGKTIVAIPVKTTQTQVLEKIPYMSEVTYTKTLPNKKKIITQKGQNGRRGKIVETTVYPDGKIVLKTLFSWIEKEPVTEKLTIGTIYDYKTTVVDGKTIQYWKTLKVRATSYDSSCYGCNNITATGAYLKKGIVAVDPRIIPMHTKMYIPGYGFGQAEDTGGAIKGNRIDLAFDDIRRGNWSRRDVTIYILD